MNVVKATRHFEAWLAQRTHLNQKDLRLKHSRMKEDLFAFFRATFYRWVQLWPEICPDLTKAPHVLAVGDLHVENFGTWRDIEGRLIWGVNDFDEAWPMSYAIDLVRLAVSAHLAAESGSLPLKREDICDALLRGYCDAMDQKGLPFVLGEHHQWLRLIAEGELRDPVHFWAKMDALPTLKTPPPPVSAVDALQHLMPAHDIPFRLAHRVAGLGSLGHARYVAIADWHGGRLAREAKALVPSSSYWAESQYSKKAGSADILYQIIINRAVRCPDPFVQLRGHWIVRRLGPHCSRIELASLRAPNVELRLLHAMGWETANIHLGTPAARKFILGHIKKQKARWLHRAAEAMIEAVRADYLVWKKKGFV